MTSAVLDRVESRRQVAEQVDLCLTALGPDLTAYLSGAASVEEFTSWFTGPAVPRPTVRRRLAAAAEVVATFAVHNRSALAGAWLTEAEGGAAPALTLRESPAGDPAVKALLAAATAWVRQAG
jgi:NADPH-dependent ferric siderophore reductase